MRTLTVVIALALAASACRTESITRIRIEPDGTSTLISEVAFDDEALELIGEEGDTPDDVLRVIAELIDPGALPVAAPDAEPVRFDRDDLKGLRVTIDDLAPDQVSTQVTAGSSIIDELEIDLQGTRLSLAGVTREVTPVERAQLREAAPGDISEVLTLELIVEVPGSVASHNATRVEGDLYVWDLLPAITDDEPVDVSIVATVDPDFEFAELTDRPLSDPPPDETVDDTSPFVAIGAVAIAAIAAFFFISRLRRTPSSDGARND